MLLMPGAKTRFLRFVLLAVALLSLLGTVAVGAPQGKRKKKAHPPPPSDLPGHVSYLAWQLRGVPLDESAPITDQIEKLVLDHLQRWLADRAATDVEVRRELEAIFAKLRYPTFARPACFAGAWKGGALIGAGYTLGWTDYDRTNVVALFEHRQGKTRLVTVTHFVPHTDIHYEFLHPAACDDFCFFIFGFRLGKSHPRLSAILYSYNGQALNSQWEAHDVYDGKMEVSADKVIIRYLHESEFIRETARGRKPPRHEAIYQVTPQGLELQTDHEIPF